jgi:hypothetical protein
MRSGSTKGTTTVLTTVDASRRSIRIYEVQQGWRVRLMPDGRRRSSSAPPVAVIRKGGTR